MPREEETDAQTDDPSPTSENMHRIWSKEAEEFFCKWHPQHAYRGKAVTEAIIRAAHVRSGMHVLDIACGSGEPALTMARTIGEGRVVATDLTEEMLTIAKENAKQLGITNIDFKQADAVALPFPDKSFDAVTCRYGVMYFSDVNKALKEIYRVLKPSSTVALVAWGPLDKNPHWKATIGVLRKHVDMSMRMKEEGNPFLFDDPKRLDKELKDAGFENVTSDLASLPYPFPGTPELAYENFFATSNIMGMLDGVDRKTLEEVRRESIAELEKYDNGKELIMDAVAVLTSGRRRGK